MKLLDWFRRPKDEVYYGDLARISGDLFKESEYFAFAEPVTAEVWTKVIWPILSPYRARMDFSSVVDLGCGHGRNSEVLRTFCDRIACVDINSECIAAF